MNDSSPEQVPTLGTASEEYLACRVQEGCAESFTELVQRLQPRLLFVLCRRLQHYADAEDVTQKTLLRAYEKIHLYDATKKFGPWLFTLAFRLATDHHRKRTLPTQPTGDSASEVADPQPSPVQQFIRREQSQDLWSLAGTVLPPNQWTALWLFYGEGQTVREIAQSLDRTVVSTRVLLYRARKRLAPHLAAFTEHAYSNADNQPTDWVTPTAPQVVRAET